MNSDALVDNRSASPSPWGYFLLCTLALAWKANDALSLPQFWAEDSVVFFAQQWQRLTPPLWTTSAGYLHLLPRVGAWIAACLDPTKAPLVFNLLAILVAAWAISWSIMRLRNIVPPMVLVGVLALAPTNGEIFGSLTNVMWFTQLALAVLCLVPVAPETWRGWRGTRALAASVLALTGPMSIFIAIVAIGVMVAGLVARYAGPRAEHIAQHTATLDRASIFATVAGAIVQYVCAQSSGHATHAAMTSWPALTNVVFGELLPIHVFVDSPMDAAAWWCLYAVALLAIVFSRALDTNARLVLLSFVAWSAVQLLAAVAVKGAGPSYFINGDDRYFFAPRWVFWWTAWAALTVVRPIWWTRRNMAGLVTVAAMSVVAFSHPEWQRRHQAVDLHWKMYAHDLRQPGMHVIPVQPGWTLRLDTKTTDAIHDSQH